MIPPPPRSPLFPYTTLFRSCHASERISRKPYEMVDNHERVGLPHNCSPDRKSTRLNSSHEWISYAVFCLKKKKRDKRSSATSQQRHSQHDLDIHVRTCMSHL